MSGLLLELKLAVRSLWRRPWAVAAAAVSLALGFAAQIVVLSCVNAVLWKPLAVPEPDRVVTIYGHSEMIGSLTNIAHPQLERLGTLDVFEAVAAFTRFHLVWEADQAAEKIGVEMVSENYFDTVRPPLEMGRPPLDAGEVLLSYDFWRDRYAAERDIVGQTVKLTGKPYVVTGVMGRHFRGSLLDFIGNPKIWISVRSQSLLPFLAGIDLRQNWVFNWFVGVGRLRPGVTAEQAQLAVAAFEKRSPPPANATQRDARVFAAERANFHPSAREKVQRTLTLTTGLAGLLLLLGCLNASLFLVGKALNEARQAAMERALGAGALRIIRRRFVEAVLLCGAAVAAGSVVAAWWVRLLEAFPPPLAMIVFKPVWDWRVWSLTACWTALAVVIAGLAPAFVTSRGSATAVQAVYSGPSRSARRLRETLVALQMAVAAAILIATGFVLRTVAAAHSTDPGFEPAGLVMAEVELYGQGADTAKRAAVVRQSVAQLRQRPEVDQAAAALFMPLTIFRKPGLVRDASGARHYTFSNLVSESYFETLRLGLDRGRPFAAGSAGANETVVNQTLARLLAPGGDILGRTLEVLDEEGELRQRLTIVGVARDAKYHTLWQQDIPYFYVSNENDPGGSPAIIVRSRASAESAWTAIRETVQAVYPQAVVSAPRTVDSQLAGLIEEQSYLAVFFGALGGIALLVAAGGLMANLYLMVSQRTREIGIRQALGASRAAVLRVVLRQGLLVAGGGLLLGLAAGNRLEHWVRPLAPGTPENDPWPLAAVFAILLLVAIASSLGPALRAARIQPWKAIRHSE
jgi:putative ABC transport system permease protein